MKQQSVITDPSHAYIQQALKEGRAIKTELSIKALTVDLRFQARVDPYDTEHVRQLHEILKMQGWLAPITVFEDPEAKLLRVADGFTRTRTYQNEGKKAIPAFKVTGNELEAIEFAAMANQQNTCRRRQEKDVRKAILMLLESDTWWGRADTWIGSHVGASSVTVGRLRKEMVKDGKKAMPITVLYRAGDTLIMKANRSKTGRPSKSYLERHVCCPQCGHKFQLTSDMVGKLKRAILAIQDRASSVIPEELKAEANQ